MSRLDRHVAAVQNKMALGRFVYALAWASVVYVAAFWVGVMLDKLAHVRPPHLSWVLWGGVGACVLTAFIWALIRRPSAHEAAIAIDSKLALQEKFSTALYARPMKDPFAQAAVKDAERTAENVSIHKRFPLEFPRPALGTVGLGILVALTLAFVPRINYGKPQTDPMAKLQQSKIDDAKKSVERALQVVVQTEAQGIADDEAIKQAKQELEALKAQPIRDPDKTKRSAARALADLDSSLKQQIANNQHVADVENDSKAFKSLMPPTDEKGPVAEAQRKISKGDFSDAVDELTKAVDKFDKMSDEEKKKAATQMAKMAEQLKQMAQDNPQQQQQMQQQMQQAGLTKEQAQKAQDLMKQATSGDKQQQADAQKQLQAMAKDALKQMNNGQGPNPQQQQALNNMMKQMQAQQNAQQNAAQMAQAAQQMAQAMKQQAQQQQGAQGGQKGQQNAQQQAQQMAKGMDQMQKQLGAMQAMKADAQQLAAAQQAAAQGAAQAAGACNNPGGNPGQQGQGQNGQWNGNGQWKQGDNRKFNGPNNGMGGFGIGAGDRTFKQEAPYGVKQEISQSEDIDGGKILASSMIKAKSIKGESKVGESTVAPPPEQEATDEVEQDRISKPAQQAVKEYFSAWQKDAASK